MVTLVEIKKDFIAFIYAIDIDIDPGNDCINKVLTLVDYYNYPFIINTLFAFRPKKSDKNSL